MTPLITRYPLDPTGVSSSNLVMGEPHTMPRRRVRAIALQSGAFFTDSIHVFDATTNVELTRGVQYYAAELYELPSAKYGKEICAIVVITDETVGDDVVVNYQALGGEYSNSMTAVIQQIERLALDQRPVGWGNLIDRPDQFPPSHHLHDVGDVFGFEYVVHAIDRVRSAILMGDDVSHDVIYAYIDAAIAQIQTALDQGGAGLLSHLANFNNPHNVTPEQLNVYTKPASDTLLAGVNNTLTTAINAHATNALNPHNTTAAQVGAYTKSEADTRVASAASTAATNLAAHTTNTLNPHNTTAAQVGAYSKLESDGIRTSTLATLNTSIAAAGKIADWKTIAGFSSNTDSQQLLTNYPIANVTSRVRPTYFYGYGTGMASLAPSLYPSGSITGFDGYSLTDMTGYQVGLTIMGVSSNGSRGFQLMANWNFEEARPAGGLKYRVNDDTGDVASWGESATLWDNGNLTKLSDLENDLKMSGATGGGDDLVFYENDQVVKNNYSITAGKNAMSAGPISINNGITVTIPNGSTWTIV